MRLGVLKNYTIYPKGVSFMSKTFPAILLMFFLTGFAALVSADTVITATGAQASGGYDTNWKAAFLGSFGIGIGDETHNGVQLGDQFTTPGEDWTGAVQYNPGDSFNLGVLMDAYNAATLTSALVYDTDKWPLGENDNAWANLAKQNPGTSWIGSEEGRYDSWDGTTNHEAGYYAYETTFHADALFDFMTGSFAADNQLLGILVNGVELDPALWGFGGENGGEATTFDNLGFFKVNSDWVNLDGNNTLTFIVNNHNSQENNYGNPAGLWVGPANGEGSGVPEPGTMLILGLAGVIGVPVYRRWRKAGK